MKTFIVTTVLAVFVLTSCKSKEKITGSYDIITVAGDDYSMHGVTLVIEMGAENRIAGNSGCNQYFGNFENPEDNTVVIGPLAGTKMYCQEKDTIERNYMEQLSKVTIVKPTKTGLELVNDNGNILITAAKKQ
jgi:heat shock protein HslJ